MTYLDGVKHYLVEWIGHTETTWEPVEHILDPNLILDFERGFKKTGSKKQDEILKLNIGEEEKENEEKSNDKKIVNNISKSLY